MRRYKALLVLLTILISSLVVTSCATWLEPWFPVGEFRHQPIPSAIYVHPDDDLVLGSDLLVSKQESKVFVAGSRAVGTFTEDYSLQNITWLNRSANAFKHKPWYFFRQHDGLYVAGLKLYLTPYRDQDFYVLAIRGLSTSGHEFELELPRTVDSPVMVDFDGDSVDSIVIAQRSSPSRVQIYNDFKSAPKIVVLPAFLVLSTQAVDLNCDGATEFFIELLPISEKDDKYELSVIAGPDYKLHPVFEFWDSVVVETESSCTRQSVRSLRNPRVVYVGDETLHLVDWEGAEDAIVIQDQHGKTLEKWVLDNAQGMGYVSGWHEYRSCGDVDLADATDFDDCEHRRFVVVSQSLTSCGNEIAPCGSMLVELYENGVIEEIWRSPASTRISLLRENGELLLHSGNSLVSQRVID